MKTTKRRLIATAAATSGLVLTPLGLLPGPAHAAGPGAFSVSVSEWVTGVSLPGMQVTLYSTATGLPVGTPLTTPTVDDPETAWDDRRTVRFTDLAVGNYTARVQDPANKHHAKYTTVETITAEDTEAYSEVSLVSTTITYAKLGGTITRPDNDLDARVEVYPSSVTTASIESGDAEPVAVDYAYGYDYDGDDERLATAEWSANVPSGQQYKVRVLDLDTQQCEYDPDDYSGECTYDTKIWVGGATAETAATYSGTNGRLTTVADVALPAPAEEVEDDRISGVVTGAGGIKLDNVDVELFQRLEHDGEVTWREVASDETGDDGRFGFDTATRYVWQEDGDPYDEYDGGYWDYAGYGPIAPGTFTLRFTDESGYSYYSDEALPEYAKVWYGGTPAEEDAGVPDGVQTLELGETGSVTGDMAMTRLPLDTSSGAYGVLTDDAGVARRGWIAVVDLQGNAVNAMTTRRDGTWSMPATSLPPGQYKIVAEGEGVVGGWVGGKNFATATVFSVPVKGATNTGKTLLARPGSLTGTITLPATPGLERSARWVNVIDAKGRHLEEVHVDRTGAFRTVVEPGTYYLVADGRQWSAFDSSDVRVTNVEFIEQFWRGAYALATATPIRVGSGAQVTGLDLTLSNKLSATAAPRISGTAKAGKTLTASTGSWSETEDVTYSYLWKRGSTVVGRSSTYKVSAKDEGKSLTVTVTATDTSSTYASGSSTSSAVKVAKPRKAKKSKRR